MLKLYSKQAVERIIARYGGVIDRISGTCGLPPACLKAVLLQEIPEIDLMDAAADLTVRFNWFRYRLGRRLRGSRTRAGGAPPGRRGPGRLDSSTGYAQIFGFVGLEAANFAVDRGLTTYAALGIGTDHRLDRADPEDLCLVWHLLHRDREANLTLAAWNLIAAAEEMTGRIDFPNYTEEELKRILTRYNANVRRITPYGEAAFRHYLAFGGTVCASPLPGPE